MRRLVSQVDLPDWLQPHLRWATAPSWAMSLALHALTAGILLVVTQLPGCQPDISGEAGESFREVGLYLRPEMDAEKQSPESDSQPVPAQAVPANAALPSPAPEPIPIQPPAGLQLPALSSAPVIGAGGPPRSAAGLDQLLSPTRPGGAAPNAGNSGPGATSFLGIEDAGKRFVYLIDSSSSMADYGAFRVAKSELLVSLERLTEAQQFHVIFCNSERAMPLNAGRFGMFFGTDSQRLDVRMQIAGINTDSGTNHAKGLLAALDLNPDVIFYLSDGGEPPLTAKDLAEIKRRNRAGARIHCIEFGQGPLLTRDGQPPPNFLTRLAAQNDGRYTYRDVTKFAGR